MLAWPDGTGTALFPRMPTRPLTIRHAHRVGLALSMCALLLACTGKKKQPARVQADDRASQRSIDQLQSLLARIASQSESEPTPSASRAEQLGATLRVEVTGSAGSGATVHLLSGASLDDESRETDAQGGVLFENLPAGHYQLWASSPALASKLVTISRSSEPAQSETVVLELEPATSLRGRVHDEAGQGLRASLTLVPIGHEHTPRRTQSDADGSFTLPSLPHGAWRVQVTAQTHTLAKLISLDASKAQQELDLSLIKNASIAGRITTLSGDAVSDAIIRITRLDASESQEQIFTTGGGPRWVHPLPGARQMPLRDSRRFGATRDGARPLECGAGHCGVDLGGQRGWPVMASADGIVVVSSRDDRGKAGRYVAIEHAGGFKSFYMHLDSIAESVEVGLAIPSGTQLGTLGRSGVQHSEAHLHFALSRQEGDTSYFVDPEPMLEFAVLLAMPQDLSTRADLLIADLHDASPNAGLAPSGARRSDGQGRFASASLAPGRYLVQVVHPDLAPGHSETFTLSPGQELNELEIELSAGQRLSGRILGTHSKAPGAWLRAYQGEGESRQLVARAQADADGYVTLRPLMGRVELEAGAPGFGIAQKDLVLGARALDTLNFDLPAFDSQLRGQIVDPGGRAIAGALLQVLDGPGGRGRRVVSDNQGLFAIDALPAGSYRVRVRSESYPELETKLVANVASELKMLQGGALRLAVRDRHSREVLSGVRVQAQGPQGQKTTAISDKEGQVLWPALCAGTWKISVHSDRHSPLVSTLEITASERAEAVHQLELEQGSTLAGILLDARGDRVDHARVWLGESECYTDADGRFRLERVASGKNTLRAEFDESAGSMPITLFAGDEYLTLDLRLTPSDDS